MRRFLVPGLLACYALLLLGGLVVTWQNRVVKGDTSTVVSDGTLRAVGDAEASEPPDTNPAPYDGADSGYKSYDPPLKRLVHCSSRHDRNHTTRFFNALTTVFQKNDLPLTDRDPGSFIDDGYAVTIQEGDQRYVVAILRGWNHMLPGDDTQYLFLLNADGKILDRLVCAIDSRRTHEVVESPGTFRTDLARKPESDGARFIVRFIPPQGESLAGDWQHQIVVRGLVRSFGWNGDQPGKPSPDEFVKQGLCRVAIRDGKWAVLFPDFNAD